MVRKSLIAVVFATFLLTMTTTVLAAGTTTTTSSSCSSTNSETITRNGESILVYSKGILRGISCNSATKTLDEVLIVARNVVSDLLLPIVGSLFTIMIIVGGIMYISSRGNPQQLEKAKKTLTAAIIGLLIVVLSYTIIYIFTSALGGSLSDTLKSDGKGGSGK